MLSRNPEVVWVVIINVKARSNGKTKKMHNKGVGAGVRDSDFSVSLPEVGKAESANFL